METPQWDYEQEGELAEETKPKAKKPPLYKVLLHNDDYTTMDFVVHVLQTVFHRSPADAFRIMMAVHRQGVGIAGVFPFEIAEEKAERAISMARANDFPLLCTVEEE